MILDTTNPISIATESSSLQARPLSSRPKLSSDVVPDSAHFTFSFFHDAGSSLTSEDLEWKHVLELTKQLVPPDAFTYGQGLSWKHGTESYPVLLEWRQVTVPYTLAKLSESLGILLDANIGNTTTARHNLAAVICVLARYVFPVPTARFGLAEDGSDSEGWTTASASSSAHTLLNRINADLTFTQRRDIAQTLLSSYIRPVFANSSSSVDPATGRKKLHAPGASLISSLDSNMGNQHTPFADDDGDSSTQSGPAWKGLTSRFTLSIEASNVSLKTRNEALGCTNVFNWCLSTLHDTSQADRDWEVVWPLVLPPLLTISEDSEPRHRLKGAVIVHTHLLGPAIEIGVPGALLLRTGIGVLLEQVLRVNLTFLHDRAIGPHLLSESVGALRGLIFRTTDPITCTGVTGDGGRKRFDALCNLISQSILSTWSYLSIPPSGTHGDRLLTRITCHWYRVLATDLVPEDGELSGVKRFLEVSLEWLFGAWMATASFLTTDEVETTTIVVQTALHLLQMSSPAILMGDSTANASVAKLCGTTILPGLSKCSISLRDSDLHNDTNLCHELKQLTAFLVRLEPSFHARLTQLAKLDARLSELLT